MSSSVAVDVLVQQALALKKSERTELIEKLVDTIECETDREIDRLWVAEVRERMVAYKSGELTSRPIEDVIEESRRRLR